MHARQLGLHPADRFQGRHRVAAQILLSAAEREGEHVEDEVAGLEAVAVDRDVVDAVRDAQLPVDRPRLALFVDDERDGGGAVPPDQRQEAADLPLAVLQVDRVDDRLAAVELQAGFDDRHLGGIQHQRQRRLRAQDAHQPFGVGHAVAADVVDHHVDDVRAFGRLLLGEAAHPVEVLREQQVAEGARAGRVQTFADDEEGRLLLDRH